MKIMKSVNERFCFLREKMSFYSQFKNPQDERLIKYEALLRIYLTPPIVFQDLICMLCKM